MPQPNFPASLPAVPQPGTGIYQDNTGYLHSELHKWLAQNQDTMAAKIGFSSASPVDTPPAGSILFSDASAKSKWIVIPLVRAIRSTNQSLNTGTDTVITFPDSEDFDTDAMH